MVRSIEVLAGKCYTGHNCYLEGLFMVQNTPHQPTIEDSEAYYGVGGFLFEVVKIFFLALAIIIPVRVFLFQPFFVQGASMEPNFHDREYLIISEFGYKQTDFGLGANTLFSLKPFRELNREDVIVFRYPRNPSQFFIKRVVALPGERITISQGVITVFNAEHPQGFTLDESGYLAKSLKTSGETDIKLSFDEYFVMGDNRGASHDSRSWGPLPKEDVIGRVSLRAFPLNRFTLRPE